MLKVRRLTLPCPTVFSTSWGACFTRGERPFVWVWTPSLSACQLAIPTYWPGTGRSLPPPATWPPATNRTWLSTRLRAGPDTTCWLQTLAAIPPEVPVILDAKRGDIGSTAAAYARACFEVWDADAVTLSPYLGGDSVRPFTAYRDRYVFVLCHTSNPSADEVQGLSYWGTPLYHHIARLAPTWGDSNVGLVVGATYPEALAQVRSLAPDAWLLAPGVGAQGGDAAAALAAGANAQGSGVLVNVARNIALAEDPRQAAKQFVQQMTTTVSLAPPAASEVPPPTRALALKLHELGCIRFGNFTLASGLQSPVYIDLRLLVSDPQTLALAARVYADLLRDAAIDRLAGVPYAALPIATAVSLETGLPLIYPRKEAKAHGLGRVIEGAYTPGDRVGIEDPGHHGWQLDRRHRNPASSRPKHRRCRRAHRPRAGRPCQPGRGGRPSACCYDLYTIAGHPTACRPHRPGAVRGSAGHLR